MHPQLMLVYYSLQAWRKVIKIYESHWLVGISLIGSFVVRCI